MVARLWTSRIRVFNVFAALVGLVLAVLFAAAQSHAAQPASSSTPSPSMHLTPGQMRADLVYVRDVFGTKARSFSPSERSQLDSLIDRAIAHADELSLTDFGLTISRAVALSHNSHTNAQVGWLFHVMPIRLWWFSDGLYVVKTEPKLADLLGARIERIGALTPDQALKRITPYISGDAQWIRFNAPDWLIRLEALHKIGASESNKATTLTLKLRNGRQATVTLGAQTKRDPDPRFGILSVLSPESKSLPNRWPQVLDGKPVPRVYQAPVDLAGNMIGRDKSVLYIRSDSIESARKVPYIDKVYSVLNDLVAKHRPRNVIVDLRFNSGGDFFNTLLFDEALPKLLPPDGHIYILVNRATFSAALVTAARLKYLAHGKAFLVGERMGDDGAFWAEGGRLVLPNSHVPITYASQFEDWSKGCENLDKCYWPSVAFGVKDTSLAPDVPVSVAFADYAGGRDPVLDRALELAQGRSR